MSKTIALGLTAAALALGASFTGTTAAQAGYYGHGHGYKHYSYGHSYGYRHYGHHYAYRPVYRHYYTYSYAPVCSAYGWVWHHGYKKWACVAWH